MSSDRPRKPSGGEQVGYRKPPRRTQFKRGQSGNPKGRPRGSRNFRTDVKSTLNQVVKVKDAGKARKISAQEAALLRLRERALNGNPRALDRLLSLAQAHNNDEQEPIGASLSADDMQILEVFLSRVSSGAAGPFGSTSSNNPQTSEGPDGNDDCT
jgi:hypothetical protein